MQRKNGRPPSFPQNLFQKKVDTHCSQLCLRVLGSAFQNVVWTQEYREEFFFVFSNHCKIDVNCMQHRPRFCWQGLDLPIFYWRDRNQMNHLEVEGGKALLKRPRGVSQHTWELTPCTERSSWSLVSLVNLQMLHEELANGGHNILFPFFEMLWGVGG